MMAPTQHSRPGLEFFRGFQWSRAREWKGQGSFFFYEIYHENSPRDEEGEHMMEVMESNKFCGLSGLELFIGPKYG